MRTEFLRLNGRFDTFEVKVSALDAKLTGMVGACMSLAVLWHLAAR